MRTSNILNIVLAIALVFICARVAMADNQQGDVAAMDNAVVNNIMTRASVRSYTNQQVEPKKIEALVRAAMAAPTAINKQPWHFIVVTDKQVLGQIAELTPNAAMAASAPLAIVVCGDLDKAATGANKDFWIQDVSAATENILLAAHGLGLGAVWTGTWPREERCEKIANLLNLPETMIAFATVVIGYPDGDVPAKDKYQEDNVSYNKYGGKLSK